MNRTQKAYHIGESFRSPYWFPDMTHHATLYDRFFTRDAICFHRALFTKGLGY